ncbi:MAG: 3-dehydroquinate synthase [Myxococcales bacterium]|nr:3-dehydroquinate synthase [Myxococcales bacterium]
MPSIFLVGFMASGKSEVSRVLAKRLNMPCVDLDSVIEEQTGMSIASLFEQEGQAGFRLRERAVLRDVCDGEAQVVATGGGTPCQSELLEMMQGAGIVVNLATELPTALARVGAQRASRPLLSQSETEIETLYRLRAPIYRRANISVSTEGKRPEAVARDVEYALSNALPKSGSNGCVVALGERSYPVHTEYGCLETLADSIASRLPQVRRIGLVSDDNVGALYGASLRDSLEASGYEVVTSTVVPGEKSKNLEVFGALANEMISGGLDRSSAIVALGGGVVGDLAGFLAASLYRGIPIVQVPTTLLAMTDSSVGGKTGINSELGKNLIGAFWQPTLVWSDPTTLQTLPQRERRAAFGELVKYALLDAGLWDTVESLAPVLGAEELEASEELGDLVRGCANVKAAIVSADERESGLRATLNLGHTVGHAIELHAGFGNVLHGEAVALGLLATCRVSNRLGLCDAELEARVAAILEIAGLDTDLDAWMRPEVLERMKVDKKRTGSSVRFIALTQPGDVRLHEIELSEIIGLLLTN